MGGPEDGVAHIKSDPETLHVDSMELIAIQEKVKFAVVAYDNLIEAAKEMLSVASPEQCYAWTDSTRKLAATAVVFNHKLVRNYNRILVDLCSFSDLCADRKQRHDA